MNKKILGIFVALMVVAMLATPVMAIGPQNAEKSNNPNINFRPASVQLFLPSGVLNEWIKIDPSHVLIKKATELYIGNAIVPSSSTEIVYNKWNFLSEPVLFDFLLSVGFDAITAGYIAYVVYTGGAYYKEVYVGK